MWESQVKCKRIPPARWHLCWNAQGITFQKSLQAGFQFRYCREAICWTHSQVTQRGSCFKTQVVADSPCYTSSPQLLIRVNASSTFLFFFFLYSFQRLPAETPWTINLHTNGCYPKCTFLSQWRTQEFCSGGGGGFNKFSWGQRTERIGIWGR